MDDIRGRTNKVKCVEEKESKSAVRGVIKIERMKQTMAAAGMMEVPCHYPTSSS